MKTNNTRKNKKHEAFKTIASCEGFTLIELAIVFLIAGILIIPLVRLYTGYLQQQKIDITKENLQTISRAIALSSPIRYPCPSNRSLPPTDPNYGADICGIAGFTLAGVPDCDTTGNEQGVCKTPGYRDTKDDTDTIAGNNNEFVLIGGVPLKIGATAIGGTSGANVLDGWGNEFTYAVSYTSARPNRIEGFTRFKNGVIRVLDEWGNDTAGTQGDAQFIILSHGEDGLGAYNSSFVKSQCALGNVDGQNCNGDNTFVQGVSHYGGTMKYDDYSYVQADTSANLWQIITDPNTSNSDTSHISTVPTGAVGINSTTPGTIPTPPGGVDVRLDVSGNIKADTVRSMEICKKDGTNCLALDSSDEFFGPRKDAFSGSSVQNDCANGEVISKIENKKVVCSKATIQFTGAKNWCPLGTWVEQIFTNGAIKCTNGIICPGGTGCIDH